MKHTNPPARRLLLSLETGIEIIETSSISQVEYLKKSCRVYFINGSRSVIPKSLTWFEEQLAQDDFIRINRTYLINKNYIETYTTATAKVLLKSGESLPVDKGKRHFFSTHDRTGH